MFRQGELANLRRIYRRRIPRKIFFSLHRMRWLTTRVSSILITEINARRFLKGFV